MVYNMELLNEPNEAITKNLFLSSLYQHKEPIKINIVNVGKVVKSKFGKLNIFVDFKIISDFPNCSSLKLNANNEPEKDNNGNDILIKINAINNIIGFPYTLQKTRQENIYKVSNKANIFPLLNYALIQNGQINKENKQGFNISVEEIQEALNNLTCCISCKLITNTKYEPYFKIIVNE